MLNIVKHNSWCSWGFLWWTPEHQSSCLKTMVTLQTMHCCMTSTDWCAFYNSWIIIFLICICVHLITEFIHTLYFTWQKVINNTDKVLEGGVDIKTSRRSTTSHRLFPRHHHFAHLALQHQCTQPSQENQGIKIGKQYIVYIFISTEPGP